VGQTVQFDAGVRNAGNADSGVFNVKWLVDGADVGAYGSHSAIPSGATVVDGNSQFSYSFPSPGLHDVEFIVDADDHIAELGEDDNAWGVQVVVHVCAGEQCANPRPDGQQHPAPPEWVTSPHAAGCLLSLGLPVPGGPAVDSLEHVSGLLGELAGTQGFLDPNYWLIQLKGFAKALTFPDCREWDKLLREAA
jgi:hypothetical protein